METTKTDNELIAEFMGATVDHERTDGRKLWSIADLPEFCKQIDISESRVRVFYEKDLEFSTSWDWLMPVVEKIHNIEGLTSMVDEYADVITLPIYTPIEEVYKAVVEFIKWYNQQTVTPKE